MMNLRAPVIVFSVLLASCSASDIGDDRASPLLGGDTIDTGITDQTEGDSTTDTGTGASAGFVPEDDFGSASTCDPFMQDCEPGEKCVPYSTTGGTWNANKCVPVLGDGKVGEPCAYDGVTEATDSCDAFSMCWNFAQEGDEMIGTCAAFCAGTPDNPSCEPGSSCSISCDGSLSVCIQTCDPIAQDCLGLGCYWANASFNCIFTTQDIEEGQPCGFINDCKAGLRCTSADVLPACEGSACCAAFCDLGVGGCELPDTSCVPLFEEGAALPGYEHVGICIAPQEP